MSFVSPRPALFNLDDLIGLRTAKGVDKLIPGLTGWAQVNGRDEVPIPDKVELDIEYMERRSFWFDLYILWLTLLKSLQGYPRTFKPLEWAACSPPTGFMFES